MSSDISIAVANDYALFPTRLVTLEFAHVEPLNEALRGLFESRPEFADGFNMHPDACNLLRLADAEPAVAKLREMFLHGVKHWLRTEEVEQPEAVDLVLFSNYAARGEFTMVHNHNADLVGIYYALTASHERAPIHLPNGNDEYFDPGDGVLILHDPRFNANLTAVGNRDHVKVFPRPGLMLIMPAYVWHSVAPNLGNVHRLSFSMNITLRWSGGTIAERYELIE